MIRGPVDRSDVRLEAEVVDDLLWVRFTEGKLSGAVGQRLIYLVFSKMRPSVRAVVLDISHVNDVNSGGFSALKTLEAEMEGSHEMHLIGPQDPILSSRSMRRVFREALPSYTWNGSEEEVLDRLAVKSFPQELASAPVGVRRRRGAERAARTLPDRPPCRSKPADRDRSSEVRIDSLDVFFPTSPPPGATIV
jgi:hypothetical protein